ncbi:MAG: ABC transporter substrate-binding protein [Alphaproteobacteria bacterium]|nr:ABC transporter substrate-binding protein [Alphaproteobacteria bacterium]TAD87698.1 MAG: ABC transporter substrate-binding protein [Alphaproteobacteria bacterium]
MRRLFFAAAALALGTFAAGPSLAQQPTRLTFGTDWLAQAEHGGFYQALAMGLYRQRGLDVTIRMGGPQQNVAQNLVSGVVNAQMFSDGFSVFNYTNQGIPMVAVAALFQKNPQVLIAHPGQGNDSLEAMRGKPILISAAARTSYWSFLRAKFGFSDSQIRPYTFSMAPFLADKSVIQQGFLTSEPFAIQEAGVTPVVHLLADAGYDTYSCMIVLPQSLIQQQPQVVQAFVEATIEGWYHYIYRDPTPGNTLIKRDNPEMSDAKIANSIALMRQYGIVDSGDSLRAGIGAMTEARWKSFFETTVQAGVYPATMPWQTAFTTAFVNKGHGLSIKP